MSISTRGHRPIFQDTPSAQPFFHPVIQTKIGIGAKNDPYERQADQMADQITRQTKSPDSKAECAECGHEPGKSPVVNPVNLQKKEAEGACPECAAKQDENPLAGPESIQKKESNSGGTASTNKPASGANAASVENNMVSSKGDGKKMNGALKNEMESGFGRDFSDVTIHTDQESVEMNQQLGSQAFAYGNDIYFNSGKFDPSSSEGKWLLAHELTHTVQQSNQIQRKVIQMHTVQDCDDQYYKVCIPACKKLKSKASRAICYAACASQYGACLASSEEVMAGAILTLAIIAAAVLILADGPLPIGDAVAAMILASVGITL